VWLEIERRANQFTGYWSPDGQAWQTVGVTSFAMNATAMTGLAVTSHDVNAINTSTFDHVLLSSARNGHDDIGDVGIASPSFYDTFGKPFSMQGAGADIWGTTDAFSYFHQALFDDGQMVIRVNSLTDTHTYAKAA
jgi:hypothetical protein